MDFPKTTKEEDEIAFQEGLRIFGELRKNYSNNNIRDPERATDFISSIAPKRPD